MSVAIAFCGLAGCEAMAPGKPSDRVLAYRPVEDDQVLSQVRTLLLSEPQVGITGFPVPTGEPLADKAEIEIARRNALLANYGMREESGFYRCASTTSGNCLNPPSEPVSSDEPLALLGTVRDWPAALPRLCVAFSGGGTRSAAYAIGVMQSLAHSRLLDRVDVISGVSGGSYALAWYLTSKLNEEDRSGRRLLAHEVLAEDGPPLRSILETTALIPTPYVLLAGSTNVFNQVLKQFFGNGPGANNPYWAALHATFLSGACADCAIDGRLPVKNLTPLLSRDGLPFPVIGMSARTRAQGECDSPGAPVEQLKFPYSLEQSYFEVTPLRQGTLGFYTDEGLGLGLTDAVALSGAAMSAPSSEFCRLAKNAGQSLGSWWPYISASHVPQVAPAGTDASWLELRETERFLADGGHVENLGVFPLLQRICQSIVVVDAEHDPHLVFGGLGVLDSHLRQRGLHWIQPLANRAGQTPASLRNTEHYAADTVKDPVFAGRLGPIPFYHLLEDKNGTRMVSSMLSIDVHYLKLSIDGAAVNSARCDAYRAEGRLDLARYCIERRERESSGAPWGCTGGLLGNCPFPQYPTTRQNLSSEEFNALRVLGRHAADQIPKAR